MAFKANAKEVVIFALVPVGGGPDSGDGMDGGVAAIQLHFQAQALAAIQRNQMIIHFEARLDGEAVHRGDVREKGKAQGRFRGKIFGDAQEVFARDHDGDFAAKFQNFGDRGGVPLPEFMHYWMFVSVLWFHYEFGSRGRQVSESSRARPSSRGICNRTAEL